MTYSRHFFLLAGLGVVWLLLSGHYNSLLLSLGGLSCLASYMLYQKIIRRHRSNSFVFNPVKQLVYTGWLLIEIIKSNLEVIAAILNKKNMGPEFFEVDAGGLNEIEKVIYANSITLTPGTVSIQIDGEKIYVHSLTVGAKRSLANGRMLAKVKGITANDSNISSH